MSAAPRRIQRQPPATRLPLPPRDRLPPPPPLELAPREDVPAEAPAERAPAAERIRTPPEARPAEQPTRRTPTNRELLRRALSSPDAARQAVLLREVLGPPVALRADASDRPS